MKYIVNDPDEILSQRNAFIIDGKRLEPTKEDIINIFNVFDDRGIPKYNRIIYTAIERYVKGIPLFPFEIQEEKKLTK